MINSLRFENEQTIKFHWLDDKEEGYPISFSVSNSNQYFMVNNIESYAIPALNKETINPNGWQRFSTNFQKGNNIPFYLGVGALIGGGDGYLLTK